MTRWFPGYWESLVSSTFKVQRPINALMVWTDGIFPSDAVLLHAGNLDLQTSAIDCNRRLLERANSSSLPLCSSLSCELLQTLGQNVVTGDLASSVWCVLLANGGCVPPWITLMENGGNLSLSDHSSL
jgi:hypothetical protein